jgi:DNA-binding NarL/FixJ family response regulator
MPKRSKKHKLRIFIVDDSTVLRLGLRTLIEFENDMRICGEAASAQEALQKLARVHCDLAIVDIALANSIMDGIALTAEIKKRWPNILVLLFSMHLRGVYAARALAVGADGYIMKDKASDEITRAIRQMVAGHKFGLLGHGPSVGGLPPSEATGVDGLP